MFRARDAGIGSKPEATQQGVGQVDFIGPGIDQGVNDQDATIRTSHSKWNERPGSVADRCVRDRVEKVEIEKGEDHGAVPFVNGPNGTPPGGGWGRIGIGTGRDYN